MDGKIDFALLIFLYLSVLLTISFVQCFSWNHVSIDCVRMQRLDIFRFLQKKTAASGSISRLWAAAVEKKTNEYWQNIQYLYDPTQLYTGDKWNRITFDTTKPSSQAAT